MQVPIEDTIAWASKLHAQQTDKSGAPYIGHVRRVAAHLVELFPDATDDELHAAWLHDAIEDCGVTTEDFVAHGYGWRVIEIVQAVTKSPDVAQPYSDRVDKLIRLGDRSAMRVKIADLTDNLDPARLALLPAEKEKTLRERYSSAKRRLMQALGAIEDRRLPSGER